MSSRRRFIQTASALGVGALGGGIAVGATACNPSANSTPKSNDAAPSTARPQLDQALLAALSDVVLPSSLGVSGVRAATAAFVAWCNGYDPVAEEMHGYGYADVRYLPSDPVPAWSAQLRGLELLALRVHHASFAALAREPRAALVSQALRGDVRDRLPSPLGARHVAVAMLAHWASSPAAWNLALGVDVSPSTCRPLSDAMRKPLPLHGARA